MKSGHTLSIFFVSAFFSCHQQAESETYVNILKPSFNVSMRTLLDNGFRVATNEGMDVPILEKHIGDSLVYYQFQNDGDDDSSPIMMFVELPIARKDSLEFVYTHAYSPTCSSMTSGIQRFIVQNQTNRLFYKYSIAPEDSVTLSVLISLDFPVLQ